MRKVTIEITFKAPESWSDESVADVIYDRVTEKQGIVEVIGMDILFRSSLKEPT